MNVIDAESYESLVVAGLVAAGLTEAQARGLCEARFPTYGPGVLAECAGRGLALTESDLADWFAESMGETWPDGEPIDALSTWMGRYSLEAFLRWSLANGRGRLTLGGIAATHAPEAIEAAQKLARLGRN